MKRKLEEAKGAYANKRQKATGRNEHVPSGDQNAKPVGSVGNNGQKGQSDAEGPEHQADVFTKFAGLNLEDLLFIEVFAGTARLSKVAKDSGFQVLPVDKTSARASQIYIAQYDLADPDALQNLLDLIKEEKQKIVAIHLAPACGTASKAREKKLVTLAKQGFKIPGPLRSQQKPMGLDGLEGLDKVRTETANLVYSASAQIINLCINLQILCSVENPENSLFWFFPEINSILQNFKGHSVTFHNCMHGGVRSKLTKWWATDQTFESLRSLCDGSHTHAKWNPKPVGKHLSFPTAQEAAYPVVLCKRIIALLVQYALNHGAVKATTLQDQLPTAATTAHRWLLDMLPRGKKLKPLVSEFQHYKQFLNDISCDPEQAQFFLAQPKGCRLVNRQIQWGRLRVDEQVEKLVWVTGDKEYELEQDAIFGEKSGSADEMQAELCTIGIPREPWDFLRRVVEVGHPRSLAIHLNGEVMKMLEENFAGEVHLLVKSRATYLMRWTKRCKELEQKERQLHESLEPHLRGVLSGKRLLVFQEMLEELGYPDKSLVSDICKGFPLTGWLPKSGIFPTHTKRPAHNMATAKKLAQGINHGICKQVVAAGDTELEAEVWRQTEEEIAKGWTWMDNECEIGEKLLAKRFGLQQSEKVRLIDDCTIGGFNGTCGSSEKLKVHSIDELSAYIAWCLTNLSPQSMEEVLGKTYDSKNAYKTIWSPSSRPRSTEIGRLETRRREQ